MSTPRNYIDLVFDRPPGPERGRCVVVEDRAGRSFGLGEWVERPGWIWALRIPDPRNGPDIGDYIDIVFDTPDGPGGEFEEIQDSAGRPIDCGRWLERPDGRWVLRLPPRSALETIVQALHDSKINGEISWFYDGVWRVKLGDPLNGYREEESVRDLAEAAERLRVKAIEHYPDSEFAKRFALGFV
jgi:hypothetical protein